MQIPIYADPFHKEAIETYIKLCKTFAEDIGTKQRYKTYEDILDTILDYHNGYGDRTKSNNFYDWIMIIPINTAVMTNGFFAGAETRTNRAVIRAYKVLLDEALRTCVEKLDKLEFKND